MMRLTKAKGAEAEQLLRNATELQGAFWDALLELECALDVKIDANRDLSTWDVRGLYECQSDEWAPASSYPR